MFRCPKCRAREEFRVRRTGYRHKIVHDPLKFQSDETEVTFGKNSIDVKDKQYHNYTMVCCSCDHKDKVIKFIEAFSKPMDIFDTTNLCDCGGEFWQDIEVKKAEVAQNAAYDGDQRRVSQRVCSALRCESCQKTAERKVIQ